MRSSLTSGKFDTFRRAEGRSQRVSFVCGATDKLCRRQIYLGRSSGAPGLRGSVPGSPGHRWRFSGEAAEHVVTEMPGMKSSGGAGWN
jgi:hypothetical protein